MNLGLTKRPPPSLSLSLSLSILIIYNEPRAYLTTPPSHYIHSHFIHMVCLCIAYILPMCILSLCCLCCFSERLRKLTYSPFSFLFYILFCLQFLQFSSTLFYNILSYSRLKHAHLGKRSLILVFGMFIRMHVRHAYPSIEQSYPSTI